MDIIWFVIMNAMVRTTVLVRPSFYVQHICTLELEVLHSRLLNIPTQFTRTR